MVVRAELVVGDQVRPVRVDERVEAQPAPPTRAEVVDAHTRISARTRTRSKHGRRYDNAASENDDAIWSFLYY